MDYHIKGRIKSGETNIFHTYDPQEEERVKIARAQQEAEERQKVKDKLVKRSSMVPRSVLSGSHQKVVLWKELAIKALKMSKSPQFKLDKAKDLLSRLRNEF